MDGRDQGLQEWLLGSSGDQLRGLAGWVGVGNWKGRRGARLGPRPGGEHSVVGTVGMWAWHGPRLHVGKKVEVKLGVKLAFNSHPRGKGGKGRGEQRPLSMVSQP